MRLDADHVLTKLAGMSHTNSLKHLLRVPLHLIPSSMRMPVIAGPLQGKRWIVGSSIHRCWLGTYDQAESRRMEQYLHHGSTCFDIGAQAGYHTLHAATVVGASGRVFAFEPAPANVTSMCRHLEMNHVWNVTVVQAAVSDSNGVSYFDCARSAVAGHLSTQGSLAVGTISLDQEIDSGALPEPDYIKIDAEGAELRILEGARRLLLRRHPVLSVETHQWLPDFSTIRLECIRLLQELGYTLAPCDPSDPDSDTHLCAYPTTYQRYRPVAVSCLTELQLSPNLCIVFTPTKKPHASWRSCRGALNKGRYRLRLMDCIPEFRYQ